MRRRGKFIVLEGLDGSGKTTQAKMLVEKMRSAGHKVHQCFQPSGGPIGVLIRENFFQRKKVNPDVILYLILADRFDHLENEIIPALEREEVVVCDRYILSTLAYQSKWLNEWQSRELKFIARASRDRVVTPDVTIFIDVLDEERMRRMAERKGQDVYELDFHQRRVANNYKFILDYNVDLKLNLPQNIRVVSGEGTPEEVLSRVSPLVGQVIFNGQDRSLSL